MMDNNFDRITIIYKMREKEEIKRDDLKENIMKNIIFRLDYQGMIDSKDFIKIFTNKFPTCFNVYSVNTHNTIDFQLNNIEDISSTLSIPVPEIKKQDVHRFTENNFGSDKLTLDISVFNTILNIECNDYVNINEYIDFIKQYIKLLFVSNKYLSLKRFGLRKIGSKIYFNFDDIHKDFEKRFFNFDNIVDEYNVQKNRCDEVLYNEERQLNINFSRNLDTGLYFDAGRNENINALQVTLDLDAYLNEEALGNNDYKNNLIELIEIINNKYLFDIFKMCVTKEFLNKNIKQNG